MQFSTINFNQLIINIKINLWFSQKQVKKKNRAPPPWKTCEKRKKLFSHWQCCWILKKKKTPFLSFEVNWKNLLVHWNPKKSDFFVVAVVVFIVKTSRFYIRNKVGSNRKGRTKFQIYREKKSYLMIKQKEMCLLKNKRARKYN